MGITLTFSYPILDWGRNDGRVQAALSTLRDTELGLENLKVTIEKEIRDVVRNVKDSESRLNILKISQDVAQKSYDISKGRFDNGDITSQELARDQDALTSAQLSYLTAFITYQRNVADLKRKTMWDFEKNESYLKDSYLN
jgi:outer membrane protein TolC